MCVCARARVVPLRQKESFTEMYIVTADSVFSRCTLRCNVVARDTLALPSGNVSVIRNSAFGFIYCAPINVPQERGIKSPINSACFIE